MNHPTNQGILGDVTAVVLVGKRDFGRCPIASRLPVALWPVLDKPALQRILDSLARQGIKRVIVCSDGECDLLQKTITVNVNMKVRFLDEELPLGTAGCIRSAITTCKENKRKVILIFQGSMISPPDIEPLVNEHHRTGDIMTVVFNPSGDNGSGWHQTAGIALCRPEVLKHIPKDGYCDIKETLIPELLRKGKSIHAITLPKSVGNFRDKEGYFCGLADYLEDMSSGRDNLYMDRKEESPGIWISPDAQVDPTAVIHGPVVVMEGAEIAEGALLLGPVVVGRQVHIGRQSLVESSVLWQESHIGDHCSIHGCLMDIKAMVPHGSELSGQSVPKSSGTFVSAMGHYTANVLHRTGNFLVRGRQYGGSTNRTRPALNRYTLPYLLAGVGLLLAFFYSYWAQIIDLVQIWKRSDEYSCGALVPFIGAYLVWTRRHRFMQCRVKPALWGAVAFLLAQGFRYFGLYYMYDSAQRLSLVLSIGALVLLLFGWQVMRKGLTIWLFLFLMLPLPNRVQEMITLPLQGWATTSAVFSLEMIGYEVMREGNIIHLRWDSQYDLTTIAVAEACNGLRMVTAFLVICGMVVMLARRKWWEKLIGLVSCLPIALLCNTVRLTLTAVAFTILERGQWETLFHDFGGFAMMPLALALVIFELWILAKMVLYPAEKQRQILISGTPR